MRTIKDIKDAEYALRELFDFRDKIEGKVWDLHKRQIKNVGPSSDDYDTVVRRELQIAIHSINDMILEVKGEVTDLSNKYEELNKRVKNAGF